MIRNVTLIAAVTSAALLACSTSFAADGVPGEKVKFKKTVLDEKFRSEGVAVGDYNKDGKLDIAAGYVWYAGPDFKTMTPLGEKAPEYNPQGYSNSFCTFARDVDGDGWTDLLVVDFPGTPTWFFKNPGSAGGLWPKHTALAVTNNESPQFTPVVSDSPAIVAAFSSDPKNTDGPEKQMGFVTPGKNPTEPWTIHAISAKGAAGCNRYSHGLGIGDVNKDGKLDIVVPQGWWEQPADLKAQPEWTFHKAPFGQDSSQMYVFDHDGDGDNDVLSCSAHGIGIWWHENLGEGKWKTTDVDKSFSQTHGVCHADINGDGLPDLITGKRWWAHGPKGDVGADQPAVLCWFELSRKDGKAVWTKHQIDDNSGVGTQFEVSDVNGDGLLDIAVSNKKGVFYFEQTRE